MEPRKASDILLGIESKLEQLLALVRSQDLNSKILSNKLNKVYTILSLPDEESAISSAAEKPIVTPESTILVETAPLGFSRTSRPETFATQEELTAVSRKEEEEWQAPQIPKIQAEESSMSINRISVEQRVVDKMNKAVFLANVEIINKANYKMEIKTRTTSTGKWQAVLTPGSYEVKITKTASISKPKIELVQEINIDGRQPTETLPTIIAK